MQSQTPVPKRTKKRKPAPKQGYKGGVSNPYQKVNLKASNQVPTSGFGSPGAVY